MTVWFENDCSLLAKTRLVATHGVQAVALWHLGNGDPTALAALEQDRCQR